MSVQVRLLVKTGRKTMLEESNVMSYSVKVKAFLPSSHQQKKTANRSLSN